MLAPYSLQLRECGNNSNLFNGNIKMLKLLSCWGGREGGRGGRPLHVFTTMWKHDFKKYT
jgi:hypothetical protein